MLSRYCFNDRTLGKKMNRRYAMAHNEVYGTNITKGVIMMVAREPECFGEYQEFEIDIVDHIDSWLETLEKYYE